MPPILAAGCNVTSKFFYFLRSFYPNSIILKIFYAFQPIRSADGNLQVTFTGHELLDNNIKKTRLQVRMAKPNVTLAVRHLHWLNWPDHGVPLQQLAPLRLIHFLDGYRRIVIHCSAGKFLMVFFSFTSLTLIFHHRNRTNRDNSGHHLCLQRHARRSAP